MKALFKYWLFIRSKKQYPFLLSLLTIYVRPNKEAKCGNGPVKQTNKLSMYLLNIISGGTIIALQGSLIDDDLMTYLQLVLKEKINFV